jgi:hypothetical protein
LTRKIGRPCLLEADPDVSLGVFEAGDVNRLGNDAERLEQPSKLPLRQRPAASPFSPRPLWVGDQRRHQINRGHGLPITERLLDIGQELDVDRRRFVPLAREKAGGFPRPLWPSAASQVGDGEQGPPVVGGAVIQHLGHIRVCVGQLLEVVGGPPRSLPAQGSKLVTVALSQSRNHSCLRLALESYDNCPVLKRVGELADGRNSLRRPGREALWFMLAIDLDIADDMRGRFGVTGIKDAAHLFVVTHESVGLIDEQSRMSLLDIAKDCTGRDITRQLRARCEVVQDNQHAGLATAFCGRD